MTETYFFTDSNSNMVDSPFYRELRKIGASKNEIKERDKVLDILAVAQAKQAISRVSDPMLMANVAMEAKVKKLYDAESGAPCVEVDKPRMAPSIVDIGLTILSLAGMAVAVFANMGWL